MAFALVRMPLVYDETINYNETALRGPVYTMTHGGFNNHVLYALLMSLLPHSWVFREPFLMRLPNLTIGVGLFALVYRCVETALGNALTNRVTRAFQIILATAVLLASSQLIYYYLVGRGYLLGCTLMVAAIYFRQTRFPAWWSDILLALSGYALFTSVYVWPGLLVVDLVDGDASSVAIKRVLARWLRSTGVLFVLYLPLVGAMRAESLDYRTFTAPFAYTRRLLDITFNWHPMSSLLVIGAVASGVGAYLVSRVTLPSRSRIDRPAFLLGGYLSAAICAFIAVSELTNRLQIVQTPYTRNAMFFSLFAVLTIALLAGASIREQSFTTVGGALRLAVSTFAAAVLAINAVETVAAIGPPLLNAQYLRSPIGVADCPVPITNRFLQSLPKGAEIFCGGYASSVCWTFRPSMTRAGLSYFLLGDDAFDREPRVKDCWSGIVPGDRSCSLYVRPTKRSPFQPLCY